MAQFDLYALKAGPFEHVVDVQSDLLPALDTRLVIPLISEQDYNRPRVENLQPLITFGGPHVLMTPYMTALSVAQLKKPLKTLVEQRAAIVAAIDFAVHGF